MVWYKDGYVKKKAFTLAEVLITLGIIGVVAAMTLPTLIAGIQKTIAITQIKRTFAILSATTYMAEADYGDVSIWEMKNGNDWSVAQDFAEKYMIPYLKVIEKCSRNDTSKNCNYQIYALNGAHYDTLNSKTYRFYLTDGSFVILWAKQDLACTNCHRKQVTIFFDINGRKGANKLGHDVFKLEYIIDSNKNTVQQQHIGKILPQHINKSRTALLSNQNEMCNKNKDGVACLALIYGDGWVFAPDYPW